MTTLRKDHYRNLDEVLALLKSLSDDIERYINFKSNKKLDGWDRYLLFNLKAAQNSLKKADAPERLDRPYGIWKDELSVYLNGKVFNANVEAQQREHQAKFDRHQLELDLE